MNKTYTKKLLIFLFTCALITIPSTGCALRLSDDKDAGLKEAISAQSTSIAHLSTQVAHQDYTIASQWDAISYLSTQMPVARGLITPIPSGITITPTPYALNDRESGATFTPTPSASIDIEYPPDMRTGITEIDPVIDVFLGEDIQARLDLVLLTTTACTTVDGLGGPPKCLPNEADGTIVDAFPVSNGEGHHVRPEKLLDAFDFTVRGLFAVYVVPEGAYHTDYWPSGEYGIVFTSEDGGYPHVVTVLITGGQIVRLEFVPGWPPFDQVWEKSDEFILSPIR